MNKFLSKSVAVVLSFLVLFNTFHLSIVSVFAQSTGDITQESTGTGEDIGEETGGEEQGSGGAITDGGQEDGQSVQVLDNNFSTGVDSQNTGENSGFSDAEGQTGQVSEIDEDNNTENDDENSNQDNGVSRSEYRSQSRSPSSTGFIIPELIISEVFFDGNNERIEIYNTSGSLFSGDVIVSGASASPKTISNLSIAGQEAKIFTDTSVDSILDISDVSQTNMGFSISDTQDMDIQLIFSGIVLDSFTLDLAAVSALANKISFHKFVDTRNIIAADTIHTTNTTTGYIANPGTVYNEIVPPSDPILKITEVYFDGDDERFEITNLDDVNNFSGNMSIQGNINLNLNTQILAGESMVYANDIYSMFQTGHNIQIIPVLSGGLGEINFDTGEINLNLIRSGQTLDTFYAHETQVQYYDTADTSFEKIGSMSTSRTTTVVGLASDRYYNTNWGIAANPTRYYTTGENLIDVTQAREPVSYTEQLPIDCNDFRDDSTANISEVYFGNNLYSPYVELRAQENIFDSYPYIKLEGSALSGAVAFATESSVLSDIDMERNKRILISNSDSRYNEGRDSVYDTNFALHDTGWIVLYGRDDRGSTREILDIIYLNGQDYQTEGNSLYVGGNTNECASILDYQDKFSPGLTVGQSQFIDISPDPVIQYISVGGGGGCSNSSSSSFNSDEVGVGDIQISAIKYFGNLQILKLKNKTDTDIDLRDYKLQSLDGATQTIKGNTLFAKSSMSFVGNYNFPTKKDYCVNLLKTKNTENNKIKLIDRYCRNSMSKASQSDQDNILDQMMFWIDIADQTDEQDLQDDNYGSGGQGNMGNPLQTNTIKIIELDYNPDGADKDNESITFLLLTGDQVDLSTYILQYIKDGKSTNRSINGILTRGGQQTFKGNFTLPNSTKDKQGVIVNLIDSENHIVDTYIYNPNKITEIPDGEYQVVSVIDGDTVKISYAGQAFNIRFAGIDAPESSTLRCGKVECFGQEAKQYLKDLLENQAIRFENIEDNSQISSQDSFNRFIGYIFLDNININQEMINKGYAREFSYKGQDYKYQDKFKSAQNYAQTHALGLWSSLSCDGQRLCPVEETQTDLVDKYLLNITDIVYNPDGADTDNEIIKIYMPRLSDKNIDSVDFADGFYLKINDKKRSLKSYGTISPGQTKILKGTFAFPNTKKTTVSLFQEETKFDTYVYDPSLDKLLDKELDSQIDTGLTLTSGLQNQSILPLGTNISIVSMLPNPLGKDTLGEEVGLLYSILNFDNIEGQKRKLNLSDGFYLKIGDKKSYFKTKLKNTNSELMSNQETSFVGNFGLPNKSACVEIGYENQIFDKFCYSDPNEGQKFIKSNGILESINTIDFGILNKAKLENIGNQICLTFDGQKFTCKNIPHSKLSIKKINQNKLYKEFFDEFENYLKDQRKIMYYDTDIKNYFSLLNEIEKAISDGKSEFELNGINFKTSEFKKMYQIKYPQSTAEFVGIKIGDIIPDKIIQKYNSLLEEYNQYLMEGGG